MDSVIPRLKFAQDCGIENNDLPIYAKRGKIVIHSARCANCEKKKRPCRSCFDKEYVDLDHRSEGGFYLNLDFYKKNAKGIEMPRQKRKPAPPKPPKPPGPMSKTVIISRETEKEDGEEFLELTERSPESTLDRAKKFWEIKVKQKDHNIKEITEAKLRGEFIPMEVVGEALQIFAEMVKRSYCDAGESVVMLISERLGAQEHDKAFMRTKLLESVNTAINASVNAAQHKINEGLRTDDSQAS